MGRILGVTKYRLQESVLPIILVYCINLINAAVFMFLAKQGHYPVAKLPIMSIFLAFFLGVLSFRDNFRFMVANGITRKEYFVGTVLLGLSLALVISIVDGILNMFYAKFWEHVSVFEFLYKEDALISLLPWTFAFTFFGFCLGMLVRLVYYRCTTLTRVCISLSPLFIATAVFILLLLRQERILNHAVQTISKSFGLNGPGYPLIGIGSFLVLAILCLIISYFLLAQAEVK